MHELNNFISKSEELSDLLGQKSKPAIAVIGSYNSGKSTLLNQLLGEKISPVGVAPTTSCLLYFDYGDSFAAEYVGPRGKRSFTDHHALASFLAEHKPMEGRVNIQTPAPILKRCRLIDTPGLDSFSHETSRLVEQAASEFQKIIYLFHQRGAENFNRLFLDKLAFAWKNKNKSLNDISFWLNCNLGDCDGTSLESTKAVLRRTFNSPVRLTAINIANRANMQAMQLFLEVELAGYYFDSLAKNLQKADDKIPEELKKAGEIADESLFLAEFWRVLETAEKLIAVYQTINSLPLIRRKTAWLLYSINLSNLRKTDPKASGRHYRPRAGGWQEGKELILTLLSSLMQERRLAGWLELPQLDRLAARVAEERFTIVAAGGFSTGKSTFFNALLKEEILPTGNAPTTLAITRIGYGSNKSASVDLPLQTTLSINEVIGSRSHLCSDKLDILENYLKNNASAIARLEAYTEGRFQTLNHQEIMEQINLTREFYAARNLSGPTEKWPAAAIYKPVSLKALAREKTLQKIRLTFHYAGRPQYDLTNPAQLHEFTRITRPENAFRIAGIDIRHPSDYLALADFLDTPGLDAMSRHDFDETSKSIRQCDAYLVFFNARHILHDMDKENLETIFLPQTGAGFPQPATQEKEYEKVFFVINFADTLTPFQQETVTNYLRRSLSTPTPKRPAIAHPKIFLISARRALAGQDRGMDLLLKELEEGIMRFRGRDFYKGILSELYTMLGGASQKINTELAALLQQGSHTSGARKQELRQAMETLREFRGEIKRIRNTLYSLGRL